MNRREALEVLQTYRAFAVKNGMGLTQVDEALRIAVEVMKEVLNDGTADEAHG